MGRNSGTAAARYFQIQSFFHSILLGLEQAGTTACTFSALNQMAGDASKSYLLRNIISQGTTAILLSRNRNVSIANSFLKCQVVYQSAMFLDVTMINYPHYFVPLAVTAATLRGMAWIWMSALDFERISELKKYNPDLFVHVSVAHMLGNGIGVAAGIGINSYLSPNQVFLLVMPFRFVLARKMYQV